MHLGFGLGLNEPSLIAEAPSAVVPPEHDANSFTNGTGVTTLTLVHTCGSGANRALLISAGSGEDSEVNRDVATVTVNGSLATLMVKTNDGTWTFNSGWYYVAPNVGTNHILVTYINPQDQACAGAMSLTGVNQTTPVDTAVANAGSGTTPSVTASSATTDLVVASLTTDDDGTSFDITGGGTLRWKVSQVGSDTGYAQGTYEGAASVATSWTTTDEFYSVWAVSVNPP
jgi:hypothetical protein